MLVNQTKKYLRCLRPIGSGEHTKQKERMVFSNYKKNVNWWYVEQNIKKHKRETDETFYKLWCVELSI